MAGDKNSTAELTKEEYKKNVLADLGETMLQAATDDDCEITITDKSDSDILPDWEETVSDEIDFALSALSNNGTVPENVNIDE